MKFNLQQKNLAEDPFENAPSYITANTMKIVQNQIVNLKSLSDEEYELSLFASKFTVLHRDFKMSYFFGSYFMLFDQVRFFLFACLLSFEQSSLYKLFTLNLVNFLMIIYLVLSRPFKSRWHLAQNILNDLILLSESALAFALYWFDAQDENNPQLRLKAGIAMVVFFIIWVVVSGLFILVEIVRLLKVSIPQLKVAQMETERYINIPSDKTSKTFFESKQNEKTMNFTLGNEVNNNNNNNITKSVVINDEEYSKGLLTPKPKDQVLVVEDIEKKVEFTAKTAEQILSSQTPK